MSKLTAEEMATVDEGVNREIRRITPEAQRRVDEAVVRFCHEVAEALGQPSSATLGFSIMAGALSGWVDDDEIRKTLEAALHAARRTRAALMCRECFIKDATDEARAAVDGLTRFQGSCSTCGTDTECVAVVADCRAHGQRQGLH